MYPSSVVNLSVYILRFSCWLIQMSTEGRGGVAGFVGTVLLYDVLCAYYPRFKCVVSLVFKTPFFFLAAFISLKSLYKSIFHCR